MSVEPANDGFGELMTKVERERGFACASYKDKCLRRRVSLRMKAVGVESFVDYSIFLDRDAVEYDKLVDSLTINVTRFFRNAPVWEIIADRLVPDLWQSELTEIRMWSAGCASGEEAYSIAMLFHRLAATSGMLAQIERVHVLGSDVDVSAIRAAEASEYHESDLTEVPMDLRHRYFTKGPPYYPAEGVRRLVRFAQHDLLRGDYPPAPQHLVLCRNVLIYFDRPTQERVLANLYDSLAPGGYLVLGKVETVAASFRGRLVPIAPRERIFRKVG